MSDIRAAALALDQNDLPRAETLLRACLGRNPRDVAALRMLADLALRIGRAADACTLLANAVAAAPDAADVRREYAIALDRAGRPDDALAQVDRLLARAPRDRAFLGLKATLLRRTGEYALAAPLLETLVHDNPGDISAHVDLGHVLKTVGRTEEAVAAYRRAIRLEPRAGDAWWGLANLKMFRFEAGEVALMQAQAGRGDLAEDDRLLLSFALGKALEDEADYGASFQNYVRGNAMQLARRPYSAEANSARLRRAADIYTPALFRDREGQGCPAADPIFVLGMPRAGSTLVEQILASHPLVEGTAELEELARIAGALWRQAPPELARSPARYHEVLAALDAHALRALGEGYIARTRALRKAGTPFFVDKMPENFVHVGLIRLALPNARIVDVRRHPMACGFSLFKQFFPSGRDFSHGLVDIGRYYRDYVAYMDHFDRVQPGRILHVSYEALVADTEAQVRRLLEHCGLPFDRACLRFFENGRAVRTASAEQVRRPIYREALDQWKHFEPWLGPLRAALGPLARHAE